MSSGVAKKAGVAGPAEPPLYVWTMTGEVLTITRGGPHDADKRVL